MNAIAVHEEAGRNIALVEGEFSIYQADELKNALLALLAEHEQLDIHLGAISEFDSSGVQTLLMLKRQAQHLGKQLAFTHHSASVREVLELLDLVGELGDPLLIPRDAPGAQP